mgnify:CR=1 FL=1
MPALVGMSMLVRSCGTLALFVLIQGVLSVFLFVSVKVGSENTPAQHQCKRQCYVPKE